MTEPEPELRTSLQDERTAVRTPIDGPAWSPARRDRRARLAAAASRDIAELYEAAIDMLGDPGRPARMLLLGHCMREIGNRLPNILNPELPDPSKQNRAVEQLAKTWRAAGLGAQIVGAEDSTQAPDVSVPRGVAAAIETVVAEYEVGQRANYAKASFLVQGVVPPDLAGAATNPDPSVQAFLRSKGFFMDHTHAGEEDRSPPREEEIQDRVRHFEDVLDARLGAWWAVQADVRDLVTRANARRPQTAEGPGDGGDQRQWSPPSDELVREAVRRIGDAQHRRAFFLELANPLWVEPLRRAGLFRTAPAIQATPDGSVQLTPWAQSQYLARMAAEAPEDVARVLGADPAPSHAQSGSTGGKKRRRKQKPAPPQPPQPEDVPGGSQASTPPPSPSSGGQSAPGSSGASRGKRSGTQEAPDEQRGSSEAQSPPPKPSSLDDIE